MGEPKVDRMSFGGFFIERRTADDGWQLYTEDTSYSSGWHLGYDSIRHLRELLESVEQHAHPARQEATP